ncbi:MAG: sulfite exporter TauE/SafE family protein [Gammaproteobacteria bacterium]|nr:sulfite exporter TauE/SafE family protein [Gammaproteobacteria bacterium]
MQEQFSYISAFLVGFLGVVHCAGMCGGIIGALSLSQAADSKVQKVSILLSYNFARIISYALAGGLMGSIGWFATHWIDIHFAQGLLQLLAALFMMALGFYLSGWWFGLNRVEKLGANVWKKIEPLGRRLMPVKNFRQAFVLGLIWGWLPCGMVYSVLIWSISAGSFYQGALIMFSFGLGTLPNLILMGLFAGSLLKYFQHKIIKQISGGMIVLFSFYLMFLAVRVIRQAV